MAVLITAQLINIGGSVSINKKNIIIKKIIYIGKISYPLYLWHWPLLVIYRYWQTDLSININARLIILAIAFLLSILTYELIERPIKIIKSKIKSLVLTIIIICLGICGLIIIKNNGFAERFNTSLSLYFNIPNFEYMKEVRNGICHLESAETSMPQDISCYSNKEKTIILWGDSHASALFPGLKNETVNTDISITQLTRAGCPPILEIGEIFPGAKCDEVNRSVVEFILKNPPSVLIMTAIWMEESKQDSETKAAEIFRMTSQLDKTIEYIKINRPEIKIVILGPTPRWKISPQNMALLEFKKSINKLKTIPKFLNAEKLTQADETLRKISQIKDVYYISVNDIFCDSLGCLSRIGDAPEDFIAIDYGHLSKQGSIYLIKKIRDIIFKNI